MSRALVDAVVSRRARYLLRSQYNFLRERGPTAWLQLNALLIEGAARERLNRSAYHALDERQLVAARRSDTVFVFGSGYSLNDISAAEWQQIGAHDTFGFTSFIYQHWVRVDFHLIRGGLENVLMSEPYARDFCETLNRNPLFRDACFLLQGDYRAMFANHILGHRWLRPGAKVFRYRTAPESGLPTWSLREGLRHTGGTLGDAVNMAVCLGWKQIVLAGVDLYDSRYFWLQPDETLEFDPATTLLKPGKVNVRGHRPDEIHNTARNGIVDVMDRWRAHLERERGISLKVLNPRSLLADVMPVHRFSHA